MQRDTLHLDDTATVHVSRAASRSLPSYATMAEIYAARPACLAGLSPFVFNMFFKHRAIDAHATRKENETSASLSHHHM